MNSERYRHKCRVDPDHERGHRGDTVHNVSVGRKQQIERLRIKSEKSERKVIKSWESKREGNLQIRTTMVRGNMRWNRTRISWRVSKKRGGIGPRYDSPEAVQQLAFLMLPAALGMVRLKRKSFQYPIWKISSKTIKLKRLNKWERERRKDCTCTTE